MCIYITIETTHTHKKNNKKHTHTHVYIVIETTHTHNKKHACIIT